jgi:hypothetical protein
MLDVSLGEKHAGTFLCALCLTLIPREKNLNDPKKWYKCVFLKEETLFKRERLSNYIGFLKFFSNIIG